jgi:prepilin-type N-terminal cleavage/methylation domain-containing protein
MKRTPQIGVATFRNNGARGFTLLEMLISLLILAIVSGAVFAQINRMQQRSSSEAIKVDMSQQAREFLDQTVRDLHMAGYPSASMYSNPSDTTRVAAGLVSVSPTQILLEGDVNNDGTVYSVKIWYVANDQNDTNCPCIRRSAIGKGPQDSLNQPSNGTYTETEHVFPPGTGPGQSGEDLFAYYDQNGNGVNIGSGVDISTSAGSTTPSGQALISSIKTVKINLSLSTRDPETNSVTRTSMSATSRLN